MTLKASFGALWYWRHLGWLAIEIVKQSFEWCWGASQKQRSYDRGGHTCMVLFAADIKGKHHNDCKKLEKNNPSQVHTHQKWHDTANIQVFNYTFQFLLTTMRWWLTIWVHFMLVWKNTIDTTWCFFVLPRPEKCLKWSQSCQLHDYETYLHYIKSENQAEQVNSHSNDVTTKTNRLSLCDNVGRLSFPHRHEDAQWHWKQWLIVDWVVSL